MLRPCNPYRKGTLRWSLMEGGLQGEFDGLPGWDDLTVSQLAEIFDKPALGIRNTLTVIKRDTGYCVPRARARPGRKLEYE